MGFFCSFAYIGMMKYLCLCPVDPLFMETVQLLSIELDNSKC